MKKVAYVLALIVLCIGISGCIEWTDMIEDGYGRTSIQPVSVVVV